MVQDDPVPGPRGWGAGDSMHLPLNGIKKYYVCIFFTYFKTVKLHNLTQLATVILIIEQFRLALKM